MYNNNAKGQITSDNVSVAAKRGALVSEKIRELTGQSEKADIKAHTLSPTEEEQTPDSHTMLQPTHERDSSKPPKGGHNTISAIPHEHELTRKNENYQPRQVDDKLPARTVAQRDTSTHSHCPAKLTSNTPPTANSVKTQRGNQQDSLDSLLNGIDLDDLDSTLSEMENSDGLLHFSLQPDPDQPSFEGQTSTEQSRIWNLEDQNCPQVDTGTLENHTGCPSGKVTQGSMENKSSGVPKGRWEEHQSCLQAHVNTLEMQNPNCWAGCPYSKVTQGSMENNSSGVPEDRWEKDQSCLQAHVNTLELQNPNCWTGCPSSKITQNSVEDNPSGIFNVRWKEPHCLQAESDTLENHTRCLSRKATQGSMENYRSGQVPKGQKCHLVDADTMENHNRGTGCASRKVFHGSMENNSSGVPKSRWKADEKCPLVDSDTINNDKRATGCPRKITQDSMNDSRSGVPKNRPKRLDKKTDGEQIRRRRGRGTRPSQPHHREKEVLRNTHPSEDKGGWVETSCPHNQQNATSSKQQDWNQAGGHRDCAQHQTLSLAIHNATLTAMDQTPTTFANTTTSIPTTSPITTTAPATTTTHAPTLPNTTTTTTPTLPNTTTTTSPAPTLPTTAIPTPTPSPKQSDASTEEHWGIEQVHRNSSPHSGHARCYSPGSGPNPGNLPEPQPGPGPLDSPCGVQAGSWPDWSPRRLGQELRQELARLEGQLREAQCLQAQLAREREDCLRQPGGHFHGNDTSARHCQSRLLQRQQVQRDRELHAIIHLERLRYNISMVHVDIDGRQTMITPTRIYTTAPLH